MALALLCRSLAVVACLLLALALLTPSGAAQESTGEPADEPAPSAPEIAALAAAEALVDAGRFAEALTILQVLVRDHPDHPRRTDVLFLLGLSATQLSPQPGLAEERRELLLDLAIAAYRVILINSPELLRVRLELARAFFLKGEDSLARRHFERVLAGGVPEPVARQHPALPDRDPRQAALEHATSAPPSRRTAISAAPRARRSSTSTACPSNATWRTWRPPASVSRSGAAASTSTRWARGRGCAPAPISRGGSTRGRTSTRPRSPSISAPACCWTRRRRRACC